MTCARQQILGLSGYAPALPTPFNDADQIDVPALERLCDRQIREGATALVVCGTTGEAPNLSRAEHDTIVHVAVKTARGRIPVIAGAGSNSTSQAIELSGDAEAAGADAILSVVPYYNKPTRGGMYAHFRTIARLHRAADHPLRRAVAYRVRPDGRHGCATGGDAANHRP
jgi:4-hydroxy-tetrahydrodipicolinate synthase